MPTSNHSKHSQSHVMFCARHFFCSRVFKTTSNVLNSDVNIVNIALIAFCSLAVTNLAHWATSSLGQWNARYQNPEKAKTNDNCVTSYRPASDPRESQESYLTTGMLPYKHSRFFPQYARLYTASASPASRLCSAGLVGNDILFFYLLLFSEYSFQIFRAISNLW